ncbi:hypothetical protein [Hugenholtzia roseola]|uniref:hypothetical protein n=1 Tax=Hugenholtzia roseola TaxID=1002 RepID=UPI00041D84C8|nr:hypothetical protein [Hugenholtzia roseola]
MIEIAHAITQTISNEPANFFNLPFGQGNALSLHLHFCRDNAPRCPNYARMNHQSF